MITFTLLHPRMTQSHLGLIPEFLSDSDPRPARDQIDANYRHGGGWHSARDIPWRLDPATKLLTFPGDPPLKPRASAKLREEELYFYDHAWLVILQPDGTWDIARID